MKRNLFGPLLYALVLLCACGDDSPPADGGAMMDAADDVPRDSTEPSDGGTDGGVSDAGSPDAPPVPGTCDDGAQNGDETGVDCGGHECPACATGVACVATVDCESLICTDNLCAAPTCDDDRQNQDEVRVDCGGSCDPCPTPSFDCSGVTSIPAEECAAVVALYDSTGGPGWTDTARWITEPDPCDWQGVSCFDGRVRVLIVRDNALDGVLPAELGNLTELRELRVSIVLADETGLHGALPDLSALTSLETLNLAKNRLSSPFPAYLSTFSNLRELDLSKNALTGELAPGLGALARLQTLNVLQNRLGGSIPTELGDLPQIRELTLSTNRFTGEIPASITNLTTLRVLTLGRNRLTGPLPADLGNLVQLDTLSIWNNEHTGSLPENIGGLVNVERMDLRDNQLSGPLPSSIGMMESATHLFLSGNELAGEVPASISSLSELERISLCPNGGLTASGATADFLMRTGSDWTNGC